MNWVAAANDPGHDTLYIEQQGDSTLNGTLNVTYNLSTSSNLSISGGLIKQGLLSIYSDGTTAASGTAITANDANNIYIDASGSLYLKWNAGSNNVYIGAAGPTAVNLNVSKNLYVLGDTMTLGGVSVCLANGSNCPASLGGANITGNEAAAGYITQWQNGSVLNNSIIYQLGNYIGVGTAAPRATLTVSGNFSVNGSTNSSIDSGTLFVDATNNRIGIGTTTPTTALHVSGTINASTDVCIAGGSCLSGMSGGDGNNYTTSIGFNNTGTTVQLNLAITGRSNLSSTFRDSDTTYSNGTGIALDDTVFSVIDYLNLTNAISYFVNRSQWSTHDNYPSYCSANNYMTGINDTLQCYTITGTNITNSLNWINSTYGNNTYQTGTEQVNYTTSIGFNGTTTKQLNLAQTGTSNITATFTDTGNCSTEGSCSLLTYDTELSNTTIIRTISTWSGGDLGGTGLAATVNDDSHSHTKSTITIAGENITSGTISDDRLSFTLQDAVTDGGCTDCITDAMVSDTLISSNVRSGSTADLNASWTAPGSSIDNAMYVYRYDNTATNKPVSVDNANWVMNLYSHPTGGTASYGHQIAAADTQDIYFRRVQNGVFSAWSKLWHNDNDGAGSGLDADTLDGISSASFLQSETGDISSVTAGSGLTGGGSSGDVTLNTGAGTCITVNADDVAVTTTGCKTNWDAAYTHITTDVIETATDVQAVSVGGDLTGTVGTTAVTDDSHSHTKSTTTINGENITAGTINDDRLSFTLQDAVTDGGCTDCITDAMVSNTLTASDVVCTNCLTDTEVASADYATSAIATSDSTWTLHNSYPAACGAGTAVTTIGDTNTCTAFLTAEVDGSTSNELSTLTCTNAATSCSGSGTAAYTITGDNSGDCDSGYFCAGGHDHTNRLADTGDTATGNYTFDSGTLHIDSTNNKIGIGTTNPARGLDVRSDGIIIINSSEPHLMFYESDAASSSKYAEFYNTGGLFVGRFLDDGYSSGSEWLRVTRNSGTYTVQNISFPSGNIGIGTLSPTYPLHISSSAPWIRLDDTSPSQSFRIGVTSNALYFYDDTDARASLIIGDGGQLTNTYIASGSSRYMVAEGGGGMTVGNEVADYAEYMPLDSEEYPAGELISTRLSTEQEIKQNLTSEPFIGTSSKVAYDKNLIGVVSKPGTPAIGFALNSNYKAVALVGRTIVKVSSENGAIKMGDYLTSSSRPGIAMKAIKAGTVIGKALDDYDESDPNKIGELLTFVNLAWYGGDSYYEEDLKIMTGDMADDVSLLKEDINKLKEENYALRERLSRLEQKIS